MSLHIPNSNIPQCLTSVTKHVIGPARYKSTPRFRIKLTKGMSSANPAFPLLIIPGKPLVTFRLPTLLLFPFAAVPSISFFMSEPKSALMTDILSLSFSHAALSTMKLDSLQTGCILLGGLFFYDVWYVSLLAPNPHSS